MKESTSMTEQDDWKEEFEKMSSSSHDYMIETKVIPLNIAIGMTTQLLSSKAHALKEQISDIHQLLHNGHFEEAYKLTSDILSAIESIEI